MQIAIVMGVYMLILYGFQEISKRNVLVTVILCLLPFATIPLWPDNLNGWFRWVKVLSVLVPTALLVNPVRLMYSKNKIYEIFDKKWFNIVLYSAFFLNVVEATLQDIELGNYFNASAGVILLITMISPINWYINKNDKQNIIVKAPIIWSILYTTWNVVFVYGENPSFVASTICVLSVPLFSAIITRRHDLWVHFRVYTLFIHLALRATIGGVFDTYLNSQHWENSTVIMILGILNMLFGLYVLFYTFNSKVKKEIVEGA